jgi:hypothetical protein
VCDNLWANFLAEYRGDDRFPAFRHPPRKPCPFYRDCQVGVDEVVIIYWPQKMVFRDICDLNGYASSKPSTGISPSMVYTNAITFKGRDLYLRKLANERTTETRTPHYISSSVMSGNFTFVSPTIYLAYRNIQMTQSTALLGEHNPSGLQPTTRWSRTAGVIAIEPGDISTFRPVFFHEVDGVKYAQQVARGEFDVTEATGEHQPYYVTRMPLDFGHLQDPVPARVYYDARYSDCWGRQSHCATITDDNFRPWLFLPRRVWKSIIPNFDCGLPSVVDPPIALTRLDGLPRPAEVLPEIVEAITKPSSPSYTQAQPRPGHVPESLAIPTNTHDDQMIVDHIINSPRPHATGAVTTATMAAAEAVGQGSESRRGNGPLGGKADSTQNGRSFNGFSRIEPAVFKGGSEEGIAQLISRGLFWLPWAFFLEYSVIL